MPDPLDREYLSETQRIIAEVPAGPWPVEPSEHGVPDQVGPICYLETWSVHDRLPVVEFIAHAREALPRYVGEVSRQANHIRVLEARIRQLESQKGGARHAH
ncbi:hypothetical protein [Streptomyces sp. G1]|uniref:hypothetical protein n=1 Tax=Streptomyces sp. G1 TaxID=361572 RepID=UPI00202EEA46|nr:hypothetical protein [Streptomyces sp. G1]MCM1977193.1 hypothetical protein [Streptomyces sp. G1]